MMRGFGRLLVVGVLCGLVFTQLGEVPTAAAVLLTVLLVPLPLALIVQGSLGAQLEEVPRQRIYAESIISLWAIAAVTAGVAWASGYTAAGVGLVMVPAAALLGWSALLTAAGVAIYFAARAGGMRESTLIRHLMPETTREKAAFAVLSVTAGVCEEFVFRGFMLLSLQHATGSTAIAVVISSGAFGVVHAYQQPAGAVRAGVIGALLATPVVITGSIVPSIIAHAALDLLSGLLLRERLLRS